MNIEDLELPEKQKANEISSLFENHLRSFYSTKNQELKKDLLQRKNQANENRILRSNIEKAAEKYLDLRKKRYEEKIASLNQ